MSEAQSIVCRGHAYGIFFLDERIWDFGCICLQIVTNFEASLALGWGEVGILHVTYCLQEAAFA